jgi:alkanesulfonate monooxygenase SsuD/methylene tetrahydromethanopterin reductase-like flavin-dependent oxidoreductase (luciferase family)
MWTQDHFQFTGQHYKIGQGAVRDYRGKSVQLSGAINRPQPVQKPHPPLWIAGGGEQLTLRTVARYADYSNFMGSLEQIQHKNAVLDEHCYKIERDPAEIKRSVNANIFLGSPGDYEKLMRDCGRKEEDLAGLKAMLYPTETSALIDRLAALRDQARVETIIAYFPDAVRGDSLERFAAEVIPALR